VWPIWILPHAAELSRKGLLREALQVAERELATNIAMSSRGGNRGTDPLFDVNAAVFERLVVLQNIVALDLVTRCPKSSDALHLLLRAELLTRPRDAASGGSPCCSCNSEYSYIRSARPARDAAGAHTAVCNRGSHTAVCNRGLLRLATLTNLAAYYRRKGLLNVGYHYMYRAVNLSLRRKKSTGGGGEERERECEGQPTEASVCGSVPPQCRAAARINQGRNFRWFES